MSKTLSTVLSTDEPGSMVTWDVNEIRKSLSEVRRALIKAGFDEKYARALHVKNAFKRAAHRLKAEGLIEEVKDDRLVELGIYCFQLTSRAYESLPDGAQINYTARYHLHINPDGCAVEAVPAPGIDQATLTPQDFADMAALKKLAKDTFDRALEIRDGRDMTRLIQRLFKYEAAAKSGVDKASPLKARLFSLRPNGAVYFVPHLFDPFLEVLGGFLGQLDKTLDVMDMAKTDRNGRILGRAIRQGCQGLVDEAKAKLAKLKAKPPKRAVTVENHEKSVRDLVEEIKCYSCFIGVEKAGLDAQLVKLEQESRDFLAEVERAAVESAKELADELALPEDDGPVPADPAPVTVVTEDDFGLLPEGDDQVTTDAGTEREPVAVPACDTADIEMDFLPVD